MASEKKCCVPNCSSEKEILHKFPNPIKDPERFRTWLYNIGGEVLSLENEKIFKRRRVCHIHFENLYHTRSKHLSVDATPKLYLPEPTKYRYLQHREFKRNKNHLSYPSENFIQSFSQDISIQDYLYHILRKKNSIENLKTYVKTILYNINVNMQFLECEKHDNDIQEFVYDFSSRFCANGQTNLNGTSTTKDVDTNDEIQNKGHSLVYKKTKE